MTANRADAVAQEVTRQVLGQLPPTLRVEAEACRIEFCLAEDCRIDEPDLDEDLLGLFEGNSRLDPSPEHPDELPRIRLFLDNLWEHSEADLATFREELRITLLHELGHYLGLDEEQVAALGLE